MKKAYYYEEAKRMYIHDGFSLDAIVPLLKNEVSRKTLYNWKEEGKWDEEKKKKLEDGASLEQEWREVIKVLVKEAKANPSASNIFAVHKAMMTLKIFQSGLRFEDTPEVETDKPSTLSPESVEKIKDLLGL